jgi:hypothetical protein
MSTARWITMAMSGSLLLVSAGCFDRDDDDRVVPGAPMDDRVDEGERRSIYDPPERIERAAERVDESAEAAAERIDESAERIDEGARRADPDEGLDPPIDEHVDGRFGRADDENR